MVELSIQVPTTPDRRELYKQLHDEILSQCLQLGERPLTAWPQIGNNPGGWRSERIEFLYCEDNKEMTIGEKRNILYAGSSGLYSVQWDSDDSMASDTIAKILQAMEHRPDAVTYGEYVSLDGEYFLSNHSLQYGDWAGDGSRLLEDGYHFHRTPFFKSVIKTEIAQSVPVEPIRFSEDHKWAQAIRSKLLTEVHIPEYLYLYNHVSSNHEERYGLNL